MTRSVWGSGALGIDRIGRARNTIASHCSTNNNAHLTSWVEQTLVSSSDAGSNEGGSVIGGGVRGKPNSRTRWVLSWGGGICTYSSLRYRGFEEVDFKFSDSF